MSGARRTAATVPVLLAVLAADGCASEAEPSAAPASAHDGETESSSAAARPPDAETERNDT